MTKVYKTKLWIRICCFTFVFLGTYVVFFISLANIFIKLFGFCGTAYLAVMLLSGQTIITEKSIKVNGPKYLVNQRELIWNDIKEILDDSWLGLHQYRFIPKDSNNPTITITDFTEGYKEILAFAIKTIPNVKVEPSINDKLKG